MEMQSWAFMLFIVVSAALYWSVVPAKLRPHYLLAVSLGYYFACSIVFGVFLLLYLYGIFVLGILIDTSQTQRGRKTWLLFGILAAIGILFLFKARTGLTQIVFMLLGMGGGKMAAAMVEKFGIPLGISYFSFRAVHYLVEVYRGKNLRATPLEFFLYVTFFPALVAGPIHRFFTIGKEAPEDSFGDQMRAAGGLRKPTADDISYGIWRILQGVVKKFVIADFFLKLAGPMMTKQGLAPTVGTLELWVAGYFWFFYLYADFSGYSDMAIGMARLFGIRVMENFRWPLLASNLRDFWRRWHISLTNWLMHYVYIPLGGSRKGEMRTNVNLLLTLIAIALWHKLAVSMFFWGVYHGVGMILFRYYLRAKNRLMPERKPTWYGMVVGVILVHTYFNISWPMFHHPMHIAVLYYFKMFPFIPKLFPLLRQLLGS